MSVLIALFVAALQAPSTGPNINYPSGPRIKYRKWKLGFSDGYKEKRLTDREWKVGAQSGIGAAKDLALLTTLYRSAVIAKSTGYSHFFTTKMDVGNWSHSYGPLISYSVNYQEVFSRIVLHNANDPIPACQERGKFAVNCRDQSADEIIAIVGPLLGQDAAALENEIRLVRGQINSR